MGHSPDRLWGIDRLGVIERGRFLGGGGPGWQSRLEEHSATTANLVGTVGIVTGRTIVGYQWILLLQVCGWYGTTC